MYNMYETLKKLCESKNITITDMCRAADVPRSSVGNLATGKTRQLSAKNMQKLASFFGVSTDYLLGNEKKPFINGDEELTEYLEQLKTRPEMRMLFSLTKNATKEEVERAVRIVEAALGK